MCVVVSRLNKTAVREERDSVFLLDEESGQTVDVTLASHGLEVTPLRVAMPTPTSGASRTEGDQETEHSNEEVMLSRHDIVRCFTVR